MKKSDPARVIIEWQKQFGRHDLPWQQTTEPYPRWVAEIMLQQTQVKTVIPYYLKFMSRFPTVKALAKADREEVFQLWAGLGYYSRAENLHRCAQEVAERYNGVFPTEISDLVALSGIGRSTAGAIRSACTDIPSPILDGNVKRVLSRLLLIGDGLSASALDKKLWLAAEEMQPKEEGRAYAQAMMDLGATVCVRNRPRCEVCPLQKMCRACAEGLQESYPPKKKRAPVPEEPIHMLIYVRDGKVLLIKRESRYWKNLWVLPEAQVLPLDARECGFITHRLTHLKLMISLSTVPLSSPPEGRWFTLEELTDAAVATPLKTFLLEFLA